MPLAEDSLELLFPFHFVLGPGGTLVSHGRSFQKWFPGVAVGDSLLPSLRLVSPARGSLDPAWLSETRGKVLQLENDGSPLRLKCLCMPMLEEGRFGFFGSLSAGDIAMLRGSGLRMTDFSPHDPLLDYLVSVRVTATALQDARELAGELEAGAAELEQAREAAEAAALAKGSFLATMSHEIRTPLNGVLGLVQALGATELTEEQRQHTETILECGRTLSVILNDVLDHSRIASGDYELLDEPFDLRRCLADSLALHREAARNESIGAELRYDPSLPAAVRGDAHRISQIVGNLLGNAFKFTERGAVHLAAEKRGDQLVLSVEDSGIGMDEEALNRLFKPFTQADGTISRRYGGTGLGLTIALQLVELMDGRIEVESVPGQGSTFRAILPLREGDLAQVQPADGAELQLPGGVVLVVDDAPVNLLVARLLLERLGFEVHVAENGPAAIESCRERSYDAILMDMQMPGMDGIETTRALHEELPGWDPCPVIALTANALAEHREQCLAAGMVDFVEKPVDEQKLVEALRAHLALHPPRGAG